MLSPRWHKVLTDLWSNKTRTVLAVLSIAIGVFAIGMVAGSYQIMSRDLARGYLGANPAQIWVMTSTPFDDELLQTIRRLPQVAEAEGQRNFSVRIKTPTDDWRSIQLTAVEDFDERNVNQLRPQRGVWPPGERELAVERSTLTLVDLEIGDQVIIELPDGEQRVMPVTGIVHDPTGIPAFFAETMYGFVDFDTLIWLGESRSYSQMNIALTANQLDDEHIKAVSRIIEDRIERSGRSVAFSYIPPPGESPVQFGIVAMSAVLAVMGVLMVILSTFLIVNTVQALLLQQTRHIGVMKAIGATGGQIAVMYLSYVLVLGVLAALLGVPLGALAAFATARYLGTLLNFDTSGFELIPWVVTVQVLISLAVPLLAAILPIRNGARLTIREAIASHGLGKGRFGTSLIDRLLERVRFLSRPLLLSLRNTFRRKARLILTLTTLTLGGAIFIAVSSTQTALDRVTDDFMNYFGEDVRITFTRPYRIEQVEQIALNTPGVARTESWSFASTFRVRPDDSQSDTILIQAPPAGTDLIVPQLLAGRWILPADENAIVIDTKLLSDEGDLAVGSAMQLEIDGDEQTWVIVGIIAQLGNGPSIAYVNNAYLNKLQANAASTGNIRIVAERHDAAFQGRLADDLEARYQAAGLRIDTIDTAASFRTSIDQQFDVIVSFLVIMAVLIAMVGGLGLMGTMSMNVVERTREIGVLRAIGASDGAVQMIVVVEGVLIGLLSWTAAVLLAFPISRLLGDGIGIGFLNNPLPTTFSISGVLIWLGIVVVLAAIASFLPAWNASRLTVRDVLAYE